MPNELENILNVVKEQKKSLEVSLASELQHLAKLDPTKAAELKVLFDEMIKEGNSKKTNSVTVQDIKNKIVKKCQ